MPILAEEIAGDVEDPTPIRTNQFEKRLLYCEIIT